MHLKRLQLIPEVQFACRGIHLGWTIGGPPDLPTRAAPPDHSV